MDSESKLINSLACRVSKRTLQILNYRINYIKAGNGPNLLLLHGANIGWGEWYPNIAELAKHFTVYALDLPGSGKSTKINYRTANLDQVFLEAVEHFIYDLNLTKVALIGHSLSGWLAVKLANRNRKIFTKLVIISPAGLIDYIPLSYIPVSIYPLALFLTKTVMKASKENMRQFIVSGLMDKTKVSEDFINYYYDSISTDESLHPFFLLNRIGSIFGIRKEFLLNNELSTIGIPTLILIGDHDITMPVDKVHNMMKNWNKLVKLRVVANAGHAFSIDKSNEFNRIVRSFL